MSKIRCLIESKNSQPFWSTLEYLIPHYRHWKEKLHINGLLLDLRF